MVTLRNFNGFEKRQRSGWFKKQSGMAPFQRLPSKFRDA